MHFETKIKQDCDVVDGYYYYIELPDELLEELGWKEGSELELSVKLGTHGNVIVIKKT
jgi:bifunctional DNA-binding transcriptional regulator/antitoxin component of YhaV-PrlF toxin-antitoxin module